MWTRSLSLRVALIAAGGSALALIVAGAVFIVQFTSAVERNFDGRLETLLLTLIAATDLSGEVDENAVEGQSGGSFSRPLSGWYWQTRDAETGQTIDWSPSLAYDILPVEDLPTEEIPARTFTIEASGGRELRALEQRVTLAPGYTYALLVAGDTEPMLGDIRSFRNSVIWWLGGLAVLLLIGIALLMRWGLGPLRRVRDDLRKIREGDIGHLEGQYPSEIEPLVADLNALIDSNREIVERARTHVGNLAHALKTPLAVLQNEAAGASVPLAAKVAEQTQIMRNQVEHHLNRARIAAQTNVLGVVTPVEPAVSALARVMAKVHQDRKIAIEVDVAPQLRFRGEKQDLEEMAGNLLDNACKWAKGQIGVSMLAERTKSGSTLLIKIEDDGPGLTDEQAQAVLRRGVKLDEKVQGSGLGLDIVKELVDVYGGSLQLKRSVLGGLLAELRLPAAKLGRLGRSA